MKKIIFVADMFAEDYKGGAELTTEALFQKVNKKFITKKLRCNELTEEIIDNNLDCKFIICNFSSMKDKVKIVLCKKADYDIIEYDYKFCKYRSIEKHVAIENKICDCAESKQGKINIVFYGYAKKIWFMSFRQKDIFLEKVKTISSEKCEVLSSVFSDGDIKFMKSIKDNEKDNKYLILNSNSWIKATQECVDFAKKNNLKYETIKGLPYHEMLIKLSTSRGLIFLPSGGDTCPRIVIEAFMLGCDLKINDNVQHKDEDWFTSQANCYEYMESRANHFMESL